MYLCIVEEQQTDLAVTRKLIFMIMKTNKNFAVRVYDKTSNNMNHESQLFNCDDYSWVDGTLVDTECAYNMSKEEAEALKAKFDDYAKANNLDWATFQVEEFTF